MLVSVWVSTAWPSDSPPMLFGPVLGSRRLDCVELIRKNSLTVGFWLVHKYRASRGRSECGRSVGWSIYSPNSLSSRSLPSFRDHSSWQPPSPHSYLLRSLRTILFPCPFNLRGGNHSLFFWSGGTVLSFAGCPKPCPCLCKVPFIKFSSIPPTWVYHLVSAEILNNAAMVYLKLLHLLRIRLSWITFQPLVINAHVFHHNVIFRSRPPKVLVMLHFLNENSTIASGIFL